MKNILLFCSLILFLTQKSEAQCTINATSSVVDTSVCGNCITLTAFGKGQGVNVLSENFNGGAFSSTGWGASTQANWNNPCSANGVDGTTHIWMGNAAPVPRVITTKSFNFATATAGVTICFDMLYAEQGNSSPCEGPDEPQEGVHLQYSIDGGTTWIDLQYWDPNGGTDPGLTTWNNYCCVLPAIALTSNTKIRWFQDNDSGADYDHWGIDNVNIYVNDPTYNITWTHDGYSYGAGKPGGANPSKVCPKSTITYNVVMTNGTLVCRDSVKVIVKNPTVLVDAGRDTTICSGQCVNLGGTAKVVEFPAKVATYKNIAPDTVSVQSIGGLITQGAAVDINVQTLNMPEVLPNSILSVCIDKIQLQGLPFFSAPASSLKFYLRCPDSTLVLLKDTGDVTGGSGLFGYTTVFNGTCFVPAGITFPASSSPYSGNYTTKEPFNGMTGCTSNGVWSIVIVPTGTSIGTSIIVTGWSITFNDPDKSYPANFAWTPTTSMTNATSLTPRVCPTSSITYTITASDTAGCVTKSDSVKVTVQGSCCNLAFQNVTSVNPACGVSNGSVAVTMTGGTTPYSYTWSANANTGNTASATGLPAGTYSVTINAGVNCVKDTTITLSAPNSPNITTINKTDESCLNKSDGTIVSATATNGSGLTWAYANISNPTAFTPIASFPVTGLAAGTYILAIADPQNIGCRDTVIFTIVAGPVCCNLKLSAVLTQPTCGNANGGIDVSLVQGSGNYSYTWNGVLQGQDTNSVVAGNYRLVLKDVTQNCEIDTTFALNNSNGPVIDSFKIKGETCQGTLDGSVTVFTSGAVNVSTGFTWANSSNTTDTRSGISAGNYAFTITDDNNCKAFGTAVIPLLGNCCTLKATATTTNTTCGYSNGTITAGVVQGSASAPFEYSIDGGKTYVSTNLFENLGAGTFKVFVKTSTCTDSITVTINSSTGISFTQDSTDASCNGKSDGAVNVTVTAGATPLSYAWSNTDAPNAGVQTALSAGTYAVTISDSNSCTATTSVKVNEPSPIVVNLGQDTFILDGQSIQLNGTVSGGSGSGAYVWTPSSVLSCNNCPTPKATPKDSTTFVVIYTDQLGCVATDAININVLKDGDLVMPNAFSPNGDGKNDEYKAVYRFVKDFSINIYNRWGEKVFETTDIEKGWDGKYKDTVQPNSVYVYYVSATFLNGTSTKKQGGLTLLR